MIIYVVLSGLHVEYVSEDKKKAELFCAIHNGEKRADYRIEERVTDNFDFNGYEEKSKVGYYYTIRVVLRNEKFIGKVITEPIVCFKRPNTIEMMTYPAYPMFIVKVWVPKENKDKAIKKAYEMALKKEKKYQEEWKKYKKMLCEQYKEKHLNDTN